MKPRCDRSSCNVCVALDALRKFSVGERVARARDAVLGTVQWLEHCGYGGGIAWDDRPNSLDWHFVDSPAVQRSEAA